MAPEVGSRSQSIVLFGHWVRRAHGEGVLVAAYDVDDAAPITDVHGEHEVVVVRDVHGGGAGLGVAELRWVQKLLQHRQCLVGLESIPVS